MSIQILTGQILDKMFDIGKWQKQFMKHLFAILLTLRGRHNCSGGRFENLSRYGAYNELSYRSWYGREFDFLRFNKALILSLPAEERIIAARPGFDLSYLPKSGKCNPGVGYFWRSVAVRMCRSCSVWTRDSRFSQYWFGIFHTAHIIL